jgi:putative ABC transport system substrate-binding protein
MITRRKIVGAIGAGGFAPSIAFHPLTAVAQQPTKIWRIGYLSPGTEASQAPRLAAFRAGLRDLGYVEGKNLSIEFRWGDGKVENLSPQAAELVRLNVDLILTHGSAGASAAKSATGTIPIVVAAAGDFVALGLAKSLAKPGGNVTGGSIFGPEIAAKSLELLKEAIPGLARAAILVSANSVLKKTIIDAVSATAARLKLKVLPIEEVQDGKDIEKDFLAMVKQRVGGLIIPSDPVLLSHASAINALAVKHRLPSAAWPEFAEAGSLFGYGVDFLDLFRRAAVNADKIFKGAKPGDIPIQQPVRFEFTVNQKTAKALGIKLPGSILLQATKVIE